MYVVENFNENYVLANIAVAIMKVMANKMFAVTLVNTFDAAYAQKPKLYIEFQPRRPKGNNSVLMFLQGLLSFIICFINSAIG